MEGESRRHLRRVQGLNRVVSPGMPDTTDVFCRPDTRRDQVVGQPLVSTANFDVYVARYPTTLGHLMIVPRRHIITFAEVPRGWDGELNGLISVLRRFQAETLNLSTSLREQGSPLHRQTVHHAHLHLIPIPSVARAVQLPDSERVHSWRGVSRFQRRRGGYHLFGLDDGRSWIVGDTGPGVEAAERVIAEALGVTWDPHRGQGVKPDAAISRLMALRTYRSLRRWLALNEPTLVQTGRLRPGIPRTAPFQRRGGGAGGLERAV